MDIRAQAQLDGATGNIRFDERGRRESFSLDLLELTIDGLKKVSLRYIAYIYIRLYIHTNN